VAKKRTSLAAGGSLHRPMRSPGRPQVGLDEGGGDETGTPRHDDLFLTSPLAPAALPHIASSCQYVLTRKLAASGSAIHELEPDYPQPMCRPDVGWVTSACAQQSRWRFAEFESGSMSCARSRSVVISFAVAPGRRRCHVS
jgi:hypothetical protein